MTVGTGQILDFTRALDIIDIGNRDDVYHTARVILVGRREDLVVFDTLFNVFWTSRTAQVLTQKAALRSHAGTSEEVIDCMPDQDDPDDALPRIVQMASDETAADEEDSGEEDEPSPEPHVLLAYSRDEILRHKDFDAYTSEENQRARRLMEEIRWKIARRRTRRFEAHPVGRFRHAPNDTGKSEEWRRGLSALPGASALDLATWC